MKRVIRWAVPADDQWHRVVSRGPVLHVATRAEPYAEVWVLDDQAATPHAMELRVYGTGHEAEGDWVGTAVTPSGRLVWHVFGRAAS